MSPLTLGYLLLILLIYAGIAVGCIPGLGMNRTTITLVGAAALLAVGAISEKQAFASIDLGTITLLFAMMVINANLRMAGFFRLVGQQVLSLARSPRALLALLIVASGVLSALFLNDPICLLFTPLVIELSEASGRDPIPYLIGLATAANVGSTATITGNPQNLIIGQASGIPYLTFLLNLGPVAIIGLVICWVVIVRLYPKEFQGNLTATFPAARVYWPLLWRSIGVVSALLIAYLIGLPTAEAAFIAAALLLISRLRPARLLGYLEWDLLAFFAALFVVTGAIEATGLSDQLFKIVSPLLQGGIAPLSLITAVLSNVVSNVPAVLIFRPLIPSLPNPQQAWLTLAMASTLAGNLTLLGSVANLIVAEVASQRKVHLSFGAYLRAGIPITILTIIVGTLWLSLVAH